MPTPAEEPPTEAGPRERESQAGARYGLRTWQRALQWASDISEADIRAENPVFIGLKSMVAGPTDLEDIQRVYRQLWLRGRKILTVGQAQTLQSPAIISLLKKAGDQDRQTKRVEPAAISTPRFSYMFAPPSTRVELWFRDLKTSTGVAVFRETNQDVPFMIKVVLQLDRGRVPRARNVSKSKPSRGRGLKTARLSDKMKGNMRKLILASLSACLLVASGTSSRAAFISESMAAWEAAGSVTVGNITWVFGSATGGVIPGAVNVQFWDTGALTLQENQTFVTSSGKLSYTATVNHGVFTSVQLTGTGGAFAGPATWSIQKEVNPGSPDLLDLMVNQTTPGGMTSFASIPGALSTLSIVDVLTVNSPSYIQSFNNNLTYAPVPEATTLIAGALLLLPFGASTLRVLRKNGIA